MRDAIEDSVDQTLNTLPMFKLSYLDRNNIGAEGCSHLLKAQLTNLHTLNVCIFYAI